MLCFNIYTQEVLPQEKLKFLRVIVHKAEYISELHRRTCWKFSNDWNSRPPRWVFQDLAMSRGSNKSSNTISEKSSRIDVAEHGPPSYIGDILFWKYINNPETKSTHDARSYRHWWVLWSQMKAQIALFLLVGGLVATCDGLLGILEEPEISHRKDFALAVLCM